MKQEGKGDCFQIFRIASRRPGMVLGATKLGVVSIGQKNRIFRIRGTGRSRATADGTKQAALSARTDACGDG